MSGLPDLNKHQHDVEKRLGSHKENTMADVSGKTLLMRATKLLFCANAN